MRTVGRCAPLIACAAAVFAACDTPGVTLVDPDVAGDKVNPRLSSQVQCSLER